MYFCSSEIGLNFNEKKVKSVLYFKNINPIFATRIIGNE
jgi:hypothetical protein